MPRQLYPHHVRHFVRPLTDAAELVWEQMAFIERYGRRGFCFLEQQDDTHVWLDIYATDDALLRLERRGRGRE
ncbi:MAG: hypothetical protein ACOYZ7_04485 [Chloroflexota bacterium]